MSRFLLRRSAAAAFLVSAAAMPSGANAGTATDNLAVSATVIASCNVGANPLAFGNYNPVSATALDAATTISVTCTNGTAYEVSMSAGAGAGASVATRKMSASGNLLNYSIYRDSNRSNVWGVTTGSNVVTGTGSGAAQPIDVYGRIPAQQAAPAGSYTDTVVVTVTY
jgi:spore coat protein U-like protein